MKRIILTLFLTFIGVAMSMQAQSLLVGDANQDGHLSVADVTQTANMVAGQTQSAIDLGSLAYQVDNSMVVGTWMLGQQWVSFNANGTTNYPGGVTYEFRPFKGTLIVFDSEGAVVTVMEVLRASDNVLTVRMADGTINTYNPAQPSTDYSMASLGDIFYSDGTFSPTLEAGKTPIGVVAYLGTDAFSEDGVTLRDGTSTLQSHGLVLCLCDVGEAVTWNASGNSYLKTQFGTLTNSTAQLHRSTEVSGYGNCRQKATASDFYACYQTWNYSGLPFPASTTGWFLPTAQQWVKMLEALGELSASDIVWYETFDLGCTSASKMEAAMAKVGTKGTDFDGLTDKAYWTSSEATGSTAVDVGYDSGCVFAYEHKGNYTRYLRPVLAF